MKQNNSFLSLAFLASIAMLGASCAQSDDVEPVHDTPITFQGSVKESTRASIEDINGLRTGGFGVCAVQHAGDWSSVAESSKIPSFMHKQEVSWVDSEFTYSPLKYWPGDDHVSFFAYAPYTASGLSVSASTSKAKLTYTTPSNLADQKDLMAARKVYESAALEDDEYTGEALGAFLFDRILAKIDFVAKAATPLPANTVLKVTSLKFYYADRDGNQLGNKGTFDLDTQTWTVQSGNYFTVSSDATAQQIVTSPVEVTSSTVYQQLTSESTYLMLIPQVYEEGAMLVKVSYEKIYTDPADPGNPQTQASVSNALFVLPQIMDGATNVGWKKGNSYSYTIDLDIENMN